MHRPPTQLWLGIPLHPLRTQMPRDAFYICSSLLSVKFRRPFRTPCNRGIHKNSIVAPVYRPHLFLSHFRYQSYTPLGLVSFSSSSVWCCEHLSSYWTLHYQWLRPFVFCRKDSRNSCRRRSFDRLGEPSICDAQIGTGHPLEVDRCSLGNRLSFIVYGVALPIEIGLLMWTCQVFSW